MNKKKIITLTLISTITISGLLGCSNINKSTADKGNSLAVTAQEETKTSCENVEDKVVEDTKDNGEKTDDTSNEKENLTEVKDKVEDSDKDVVLTSKEQAKSVTNTQTNDTSKKESVNSKNNSVQAVNETTNKSVSTSNSVVNQAVQTNNSSINYWAEVENGILAIVNQERSKAGQASVSLNLQMKNIARDKSKEMIELNYFDHNSPKNGYVSDVLKKQGIAYHWVGENIAMFQGGSMSADAMAKKLMDMWMNSPGHRANILNENFKEIGIGVARQGNLIKATQVFYTKQ